MHPAACVQHMAAVLEPTSAPARSSCTCSALAEMRAQLVPAHPKSIDAAAPAPSKGTLSELRPAGCGIIIIVLCAHPSSPPLPPSPLFGARGATRAQGCLADLRFGESESQSLGGTSLHARSPAPAVTCGAPPLAAGHRLGLECDAWRLKPLETGVTARASAASPPGPDACAVPSGNLYCPCFVSLVEKRSTDRFPDYSSAS